MLERLGRRVQLLEPPDRRHLREQVAGPCRRSLIRAIASRVVWSPGPDPRTDDRERARPSFGLRHHPSYPILTLKTRISCREGPSRPVREPSSRCPSRISPAGARRRDRTPPSCLVRVLRRTSCSNASSDASLLEEISDLGHASPPSRAGRTYAPPRTGSRSASTAAARCVAGRGLHFGRDGLSDLRSSQSARRALLCGLRQRARRRRPSTRGTQGRHDPVLRPRRVHRRASTWPTPRMSAEHPADVPRSRARERSSASGARSRSSSATR